MERSSSEKQATQATTKKPPQTKQPQPKPAPQDQSKGETVKRASALIPCQQNSSRLSGHLQQHVVNDARLQSGFSGVSAFNFLPVHSPHHAIAQQTNRKDMPWQSKITNKPSETWKEKKKVFEFGHNNIFFFKHRRNLTPEWVYSSFVFCFSLV